MKTEHLIDVLSANLEPIGRRNLRLRVVGALCTGLLSAYAVMSLTVSTREDVTDAVGFVAVKLLFAASLIITGAWFLCRAIVPGRDVRYSWRLMSLPWVGVALAVASVAVIGSWPLWATVMKGTQWGRCVLCIPLFAAAPYLALIWALRQGAPTDLDRVGAVAGLVAGAIGATAYAFHCPDDSLPFVALWYGTAILICAFAGWVVGPRLLRW